MQQLLQQSRYTGLLRIFDIQGDIDREVNYVNGVLHGQFTYWSGRNGQINNYIEYTCNYEHGLLEGEYKEFTDSGEVQSQVMYKKGLREGEWTTYYDSGEIESVSHYVNGNLEGVE